MSGKKYAVHYQILNVPMVLLTLGLLAYKTFAAPDLSWWAVFAPLWGPVALGLAVLFLFCVVWGVLLLLAFIADGVSTVGNALRRRKRRKAIEQRAQARMEQAKAPAVPSSRNHLR